MTSLFTTRLMVCLAATVTGSLAFGVTTTTLAKITGDNIGEFVAVQAKVAAFYYPIEPRAPYALLLKDDEGGRMRVTIWSDIFNLINQRDDLKTTGTALTLTAEVAEYNDKLELHLADPAEISIIDSPTSPTAATTPPSETAENTTTTTAPE